MLVVQIALGIVLAAIILAFLPYILALVLVVGVAAFAIALLVTTWPSLTPASQETIMLISVCLPFGVVGGGAVYRAVEFFFLSQPEPSMEEPDRKRDENPAPMKWVHCYTAVLWALVAVIVISEAPQEFARRLLALLLVWAVFHVIIQVSGRRIERRRHWRQQRRDRITVHKI
jgi:hypothetical protein